MKPTNEAGAQINIVGGQELTDDGYLNENWTHYLTVLHYTSEKTGYQVIGTYTGTTGCGTTDAATAERKSITCTTSMSTTRGLICRRCFIPDLLNDTAADGYGRAKLSARRGSFRATAATTSMRRSPPGRAIRGRSSGTPATTPAPTSTQRSSSRALTKRRRNGESTGAKAEKTDAGWRFVTHEGMSNTIVTLLMRRTAPATRSQRTGRSTAARKRISALEPRPRR